ISSSPHLSHFMTANEGPAPVMLRILVALALSLLVAAAVAQDKKPAKKPEAGDSRPEAKKTTAVPSAAKASPATKSAESALSTTVADPKSHPAHKAIDYFGLLFVFVLATFIGLGVVARVSRLLHTPLMSLT